MLDVKTACRTELMTDVDAALENILHKSIGENSSIIHTRLADVLVHNQLLHNSRTSYVHHFFKNWFSLQRHTIIQYELSLAATICEGIIHDIDNRIDGHATDTLNSCFLQAYGPLITQECFINFSQKSKRNRLAADFFLKNFSSILLMEQYNFINEINQVPILENRIQHGNSLNAANELLQLMLLRAKQTTICAKIIIIPYVKLKLVPVTIFKLLLEFFQALHIVDGLRKDYDEIQDDIINQRFNTWEILKRLPLNAQKRYVLEIMSLLEIFKKPEIKQFYTNNVLAEYFVAEKALLQELFANELEI